MKVPQNFVDLAEHRAVTYGKRFAVVGGIMSQGEPSTFHVTPYENLNGRRPLYLTKE